MRISSTRIYWVWQAMLRRCETPTNADFRNYGARGIKVCDRWHSFPLFLHDVGEAPEGMTLERIDNNGDYKPENCRWATRKEQARNLRKNMVVEFRGVTKPLIVWCEDLGLRYEAVRQRYSVGDRGETLFRPTVYRTRPKSRAEARV
jgi:hypothetical protein